MECNLDKFYKTNEEKEIEGFWHDIDDNCAIKIRRWGGKNNKKVSEALAQFYDPYARRLKNKSLSSEKEDELTAKSFAHACIIEWRGLVVNGEEFPCNFENATKLMISYPDLRSELMEVASTPENFREDVGN